MWASLLLKFLFGQCFSQVFFLVILRDFPYCMKEMHEMYGYARKRWAKEA